MIADLPVGKNLQDHIFPYGLNFVATAKRPKGEFWTHIEARVHTLPNLISNLAVGRGPISSPGGLDAMGFVRTSYANRSLPSLPDFQLNFLSGCLTSGKYTFSYYYSLTYFIFTDDGWRFPKVVGLTEEMWQKVFKPFLRTECYTVLPVLLKPRSSGFLTLRSRNPYDKPLIDPNYFAHPDDLESMAEAMTLSYMLATSPPLKTRFKAVPSKLVVPGTFLSQTYVYLFYPFLFRL